MRHLYLLIVIILGIFNFCPAKTIYVKKGVFGDGTSWKKPFSSLSQALAVSKYGDEIWVARGTYFPSDCNRCTETDRKKTFLIPDGVKIYGGFAGNESRQSEYAPMKNPTLLSGEIGYDDKFDNSFSVVTFQNVSSETILDGLTIMGGFSNGDLNIVSSENAGAGIYNICDSDRYICTPQIRNCLIFENQSFFGGAIANISRKGTAIAVFINCKFVKNLAVKAGSILFEKNELRNESSVFTKCKFVNNLGKSGVISHIPIQQHFTDCFFIENEFTTEQQKATKKTRAKRI